ncbi:hypothetical protein, partial [Sinorhizobium meliloti]
PAMTASLSEFAEPSAHYRICGMGRTTANGRRRSHHRSDAQKAFMCRVAEICAKAGISQATYIDWKKKSGLRLLS